MKDLQHSIQSGIQRTVTELEVALRVRTTDELNIVLFFLEELSKIRQSISGAYCVPQVANNGGTAFFCSSVESVGHVIANEVLQWLGRSSSLAEHSPARLKFWLEFLVQCSSYPWGKSLLLVLLKRRSDTNTRTFHNSEFPTRHLTTRLVYPAFGPDPS